MRASNPCREGMLQDRRAEGYSGWIPAWKDPVLLCFWLIAWVKEPSSLVPWVVTAFPVTSAASTFQPSAVGKG